MPLQKRHLKFNCTRCRNNEINDCLRKTIEDKEQIIEDKNIIIKMLQDRINELENNSKTYANILTMNTENQPSSQTTIKNIPVVIIKPLNPQDGELTKAEIQKKINPNSINVSINSLKTARNGNVTIKCSSIEGAEKLLQETKKQKLDTKYDIQLSQMKKPRIKIIRSSGEELNKEEIENCLRNQNSFITNEDQVTMKPHLAASMKQLNSTISNPEKKKVSTSNKIAIGTICKNGGCGLTYQGPETDSTPCTHHPGVPIFHEGMKYWSCCQKKTTDFNTFLSQVGCEQGSHVWQKNGDNQTTAQCRWDFHQTSSHVITSIYAKQYCPNESFVKLNPIRLYVKMVFPQQENAAFVLDVELRGIVNVEASEVTMFGTKVEIKLRKAEPGSWLKLGDPIKAQKTENNSNKPTVEKITPKIEAVDLDDL
ncbi:hypothetical protein JTB14_015996 [Gonioctena quinquepunctata]|nr:hypothetical protein JTB14_015996 [Gonioctena quinquepunctata]